MRTLVDNGALPVVKMRVAVQKKRTQPGSVIVKAFKYAHYSRAVAFTLARVFYSSFAVFYIRDLFKCYFITFHNQSNSVFLFLPNKRSHGFPPTDIPLILVIFSPRGAESCARIKITENKARADVPIRVADPVVQVPIKQPVVSTVAQVTAGAQLPFYFSFRI